ncbi:MAG: flagellar basal-body MS-ring/collar protein FliF [Acidimicrobiales bacterium]
MALLPFNAETLSAVSGRARSAFSGFTTGQRVISVLAAVGLVIGGVAFMNLESKPSYQPLFTNLQASDSGAVVAQLTTSQIPYQLTNGGSTILVPANMVDQERVALAQQGLPNSGTVGFSNLEKSGITTSQFVQQVEYQQALEGQLQQTIDSIQGIQTSQVNLVVPTQSTFAIGNQPPTTASILVDLAPGVTLSSGQVQAIVHLAASATPGLTASNVTVVDNHGDVLSSAGVSSGGNGSSNSQQTAAYDRNLSNSIETLLYRLVGVGNAQVQVHALLDFNKQSTTTKGIQVNAKGVPIVAPTGQTSTSSSYTGAGTPPAGVLGSGTPTTIAGANGKYTSTSSQTTNAVGQVTETINQAPGQVVKTSVAVLINSAAKPKVSVSKVKALVTAAAGLNTANGDQLVVTALKFATPVALPAAAANSMQLYMHIGTALALVLFILGLLFFALRAAKKTKYDEVEVAEYSSPQPRSIEGNYASVELPPSPLSFANMSPEAVMTQVNSYIEQRPAEVARLLRGWADEKGKESS